MSAGLVLCLNDTTRPRISAMIAAPTATPVPSSKYHDRAAVTRTVPSVRKPFMTTSSIVIARSATGGAYEGELYMSFNCCGLGAGPDQVCWPTFPRRLNIGFLLSTAALHDADYMIGVLPC